MTQISVSQFFEDMREELHLELLAGVNGLTKKILEKRFQKNSVALTGFLKSVHPDRIQVWGNTELTYLGSLDPTARKEAVSRFFSLPLCALLVSGGEALPEGILELAEGEGVPLIRSSLQGEELLPQVTTYLESRLAPHALMHGVLIDLYGVGVLILGKSGIGKSECALHLVTRGHRLVADDVVDMQLHGQELVGHSTDLLKHHLEVRGLGVLNIKDLFGVVAIRYEKNVEMIVELVPWSSDQPFERLGMDLESKEILGKSLPLVRIPVAPGRNVPTLIEVAARNRLLQRMGYFSAQDFSRNLTAQIAMEHSRLSEVSGASRAEH
ncbi:MAG: HPr(Ser) kinase/phosphatase [Nitrospinota bacterium]